MSKLGYEAFVSGMQQLANTINAIRQQESQQKFQKQQAGLDRQQQRDLQSNQFVQQKEMAALELTNRLKEMKEANTYQTGRDEALHGYDMAKMGKANEYTQSNMRLQSGLNQKDAFYSYNLDAYSRGIADKIKLAQLANLNMVNQATADTYGYDIDTTTGEVYPPAREPMGGNSGMQMDDFSSTPAYMFNFGEEELDRISSDLTKATTTKLLPNTSSLFGKVMASTSPFGAGFNAIKEYIGDPISESILGSSKALKPILEAQRSANPAKAIELIKSNLAPEFKAMKQAEGLLNKKGGVLSADEAEALSNILEILKSSSTPINEGEPTRLSALQGVVDRNNNLTVNDKQKVLAETVNQIPLVAQRIYNRLKTMRTQVGSKTYDQNLEKGL